MKNHFKGLFERMGLSGSFLTRHDLSSIAWGLLKAAFSAILNFMLRRKMEERVEKAPMELPDRWRIKPVPGQIKRAPELEKSKPVGEKRVPWWLGVWTSAFACLLLIIAILVYFVPGKKPEQEQVRAQITPFRCIPPGNNPVILTLSDGKTVQPDKHPPGLLWQEDDMKLVLDSGCLSYQLIRQDHPSDTLRYNRLFVPKGRVYGIVLSDGSKVWVNSDTRLHYPVVFSSTFREVEVDGEAYFEVAPDAARPFRVKANGLMVNVLGTSFDINSYADERNIRFSLTSGQVMLRNKGNYRYLNVGQRVELNKVGGDFVELPANGNVDPGWDDLGWMEGEFRFTETDLAMILPQVARWYDLTLVLRCPLGTHSYTCTFSRASTLSEALHLLSNMCPGLHFNQNGKNLVISR